MRYDRVLLFLATMLLVISVGIACYGECTFRAAFHNNTDQKVTYNFKWIDHPYEYVLPVDLAGGELAPDQTHALQYDYLCGEYYVKWSNGYKYAFSSKLFKDQTAVLEPQ